MIYTITMNNILLGLVFLLSVGILLIWSNQKIDNRMDDIELGITNLQRADLAIVEGVKKLHSIPPSQNDKEVD